MINPEIAAQRLKTSSQPAERGCIVWTGYCNKDGYGILSFGGKMQIKAHRLSWIINNGPIPARMVVCHHCDNPACIEPSHLFIGTQRDNIDDMMRKGRHASGPALQRALRGSHFKIPDQKVAEIYRLKGSPRSPIAETFGISKSLITMIWSGKYRPWAIEAGANAE